MTKCLRLVRNLLQLLFQDFCIALSEFRLKNDDDSSTHFQDHKFWSESVHLSWALFLSFMVDELDFSF